MKECTKCGSSKPLTEFYKRSDSKTGTHSWCKSCYNKVTTSRQRFKITGCSSEDYESLYNKQAGCCAICGNHASQFASNLAADHCHTTGKLRGLLCGSCNRSLGYFKDNVNLLLNAIDYLKRSQ